MMGATGAVEAIFSVLAIRDQVAPPTINLDNPGEGCDLDRALSKEADSVHSPFSLWKPPLVRR